MSRSLRAIGATVVGIIIATLAVATGTASAATAHRSIVTATSSANTPHVLDNRVLDLAEVGNRIVVVGDFTQVREAPANGGSTWAQPYVFAFDPATGRIDRSFAPAVAGQVNAVAAGPNGTVYLGGTFATVNGATARNLVQVSLATGARVEAFRPSGINGAVNDITLAGDRLFLGGFFNSVWGFAHAGLATVHATTGAHDPFLGVDVAVNHNWPNGTAKGSVGVKDLDVSPDGTRLVAIGNFKRADGLTRDQVVSVLLSGQGAVVDPNWRTRRYEPACHKDAYDYYVRDVDFAPDGSYFVVVTTGAKFAGTLCDTAARWDVGATGDDVQPAWISETGGDTLHSVAITGAAVYVGGHQRWLNNPWGTDRAGAGAVPRAGIGALDPRTGIPLSWNPGRHPRGIGAEALLATASGLFVGSDTEYIGARQFHRPRLAYFPLAGGTAVAAENVGAIPGTVYLAGRSSASGEVGVNDLIRRPFDGTTAGSNVAVAGSATDWGRARGAFLVDRTLYYGWQNSSTSYTLHRRTFDGTRFGAATRVDPYNDPVWSNVDSGSNTTFRGALPTFYSEISSVTAMAYRDGRLYYTRSGFAQLFYRHFSPESGIVGETRFTAASSGFSGVGGLILGDQVYVTSAASGSLYRITYNSTGQTSSVLVSGPTRDGRDWRTRALFLGPAANQAPVAAFTNECVGLSCALDASGSTDPDGSVASYRWDFEDGTSDTGVAPQKTFAAAGSYSVRLTVTDELGASSSTTQVLTVAPAAEAGIAFRASAGTTARPASVVSVEVPAAVQAGDGLVLVLSTNSAVTGAAPAGWTAAGSQAAGTAMTTQVFSRVASAADAGSRVQVALSGSAAASLQLVAYSGTSASGPVASLVGAADGAGTAHTTPPARADTGSMVLSVWSDKSSAARQFVPPAGVSVRTNLAGAGNGDVATLVADSGAPVPAGQVGGQTATVPVSSSRATMLTVVLRAAQGAEPAPTNEEPEAAMSSSCAELTCAFDSAGSADPDGTVQAVAWDFGDGQTSSEPAPTHTYGAAGEYTVTLTVTDDAGASSATTATVTVAAAPVGQGIGLRGSAGTAARPATAVSVDVPAAVQAGDGLVLVLSTNSAVTGTAPAGWALAGTQTDGGRMTTQVFSRVASAQDAGSTVTVSVGTVSSALTLQLMAYSGTSATGPVASVTGAAGGAGTSHTTPMATAESGSWVLSVWSDKAPEERLFVPPAGLAERSNLAGVGNGDVATLVADSGAPVPAGQVGGLTATVPTPSSRSTMLTVVLTPAG